MAIYAAVAVREYNRAIEREVLVTTADMKKGLSGLATIGTIAAVIAVPIVLGITAALSIAGPAWRAARVDPAVALRNP